MAVTILLNGEPREVPEGTSLRGLIELLELRHEQVAIEVNRRIVRREQRGDTRLAPGDEVELVTLVGGG